ncbi:MAG: hypothetical protein IT373_35560 [Polyangiaceae bacterium]|nr:hypothetical protein [Polyangiaceae bacterium]
MLDRVAMHQTRLRTPGLGLDARGVALGAKGLVLLPSVDRLVAFLALYTSSASLGDLLGSLRISVVKSKLGHREVVLAFAADSTDRMDRVSEIARLAGGYVLTGTSRHFVQYRDAAAPFGYDLRQISPTEAALSLNHTTFSQEYAEERTLDLAEILTRLEPRLDPSAGTEPGPRWICAEQGLGPALLHYFVRSVVPAEVGVAEWPPASGFDETPERRYLFKVESVPERMAGLLGRTPGISVFVPAGPGVAVEVGFRHPIQLRACPVFDPKGLLLFRGRGQPPLVVARLPQLGPVGAFAHVVLQEGAAPRAADKGGPPRAVEVPLRLAHDTEPLRNVTATFVPKEELGLLRQLAYRLGRAQLETTEVAFTAAGAFLLRPEGIEGIPVGSYFRQLHPQIFVAAGYTPVPAVAAEVLFRALGAPARDYVFLLRSGERVGIAQESFTSLAGALLGHEAWTGVGAVPMAAELTAPLPVVELEDPGYNPLRDVHAAAGTGEPGR